jgi:uncharacterized protein (DUF2235 family)
MSTTVAGASTPHSKKRLVLCFDGTWNTPEDHTNVSRLYAAIPDESSGCKDQLKFYDAGVGTTWGEWLRGGALGWGLDQNILQGYCWLIKQYNPSPTTDQLTEEYEVEDQNNTPQKIVETFEDGDEIFLFGFSRGAFTARSLAGLINRCGLLKADLVVQQEKQKQTTRRSSLWKFLPGAQHSKDAQTAGEKRSDLDEITPDAELVKTTWNLYRQESTNQKIEARLQREWAEFRQQYSWNVKIKFVGVWDTVGALGLPTFYAWVPLSRASYKFHDTTLGRVIEHAFHAVAIDENRKDYDVTLWTQKYATQEVEQRWFPGAHANVGGGYEDDRLPDPPLAWLAQKAIDTGLEFNKSPALSFDGATCTLALPPEMKLDGNEYLSTVRDSYKEFMGGAYQVAKLGQRWYRPMLVHGVNETIDPTANLKWARDPTYRPHNLAYAGRADVNKQ